MTTKETTKRIESAVQNGEMTLEYALEEAMAIGFKEASERAYIFFSKKVDNLEEFTVDYIKALGGAKCNEKC